MSEEWEELYSEKHKRKYWKNKKTGESSWKEPSKDATNDNNTPAPAAAAPAHTAVTSGDEWDELFSEKHKRKYWKNKTTGKTSWTAPHSANPNQESKSETPSVAPSVAQEIDQDGGEWKECYSEKYKKKYWKNTTTGKTSWTPPANAGAGTETVTKPESKPAQSSGNHDWEELYSEKHKRKYWKNKVSGKTSWTAPAGNNDPTPSAAVSPLTIVSEVHAGCHGELWEELYSEKHKRKYWKNRETGKTSWTKPVEEAQTKPIVNATPSAEAKAEEWVEGYSEKHKRKYWKNTSTGKISWTAPPAQVKSSASVGTISAAPITTTAAPVVEKPAYPKTLYIPFQPTSSGCIDQLSYAEITLAEQMAWKFYHLNASALTNQANNLQSAVLDGELVIGSRVKVVHDKKANTIILITENGDITWNMKYVSSSTASAIITLLQAYVANDQIGLSSDTLDEKVQVNKEALLPPLSSLAVIDAIDLIRQLGNNFTPYTSMILDDASHFIKGGEISDDLKAALSQLSQALKQRQERAELTVFRPSILSDSTLNNAENANTIPLNGIYVIQVANSLDSISGLHPTAVGTGSGWTPCWIQIDQSEQSICFHEHGPSQPASFTVLCQDADILLPDLTEFFTSTYITIKNAILAGGQVKLDVAFQFKTIEELWRTALSLSSVCAGILGKYADISSIKKLNTSESHTHRKLFIKEKNSHIRRPLSFLTLTSYTQDFLMGLESMLADRLLCSENMKYIRLSGAQLRSVKFQHIHQRIVITNKGTCAQLIEGSILLSINGLSSLQVPSTTVMKFIAEVPKQMQTDLILLAFPRLEYLVDILEVEMPATMKQSDEHPDLPHLPVNKYGNAQRRLGTESAVELSRVIAKKRSSIAVNAGDMIKSDVSAATAEAKAEPEIRDRQVSLDQFYAGDINTWKWTKYSILLSNGKLLLCNPDGPLEKAIKISISSLQLKVIFPNTGCSLTDLCLLLSDGQKLKTIIHCPNLQILQSLLRKTVIAMKLHNVLPVDLPWLYHQAEAYKRNREYQFQHRNSITKTPSSLSSILTSIQNLQVEELASDQTLQSHSRPHVTVIQAAEALEEVLSTLHLPPNFPSPETIDMHIREMKKINKSNHQMIAEILMAQMDLFKPLDGLNASNTNTSSSTTKAIHVIFPDTNAEGNNEMEADDNPTTPSLASMREAVRGNNSSNIVNLLMEDDEEVPVQNTRKSILDSKRPTKATRRSSRLSIINDMNHNTSIASLVSSSPMVGGAGGGGSASTSVTGFHLTPEETSSLATLLSHFRQHVDEFSQILLRSKGQDSKTMAFLIAHRFYHPWSCDQYYLGQLLCSLLRIENEQSSPMQTNKYGYDKSSFLPGLLQELCGRFDFTAFFLSLYEGVRVDALQADSDVPDLCSRIVEPICLKLESSLQTSFIPAGLRYALIGLQQGSTGSDMLQFNQIKRFLCQCIVTHTAQYLHTVYADMRDTAGRGMTEQQGIVMIGRVKDLIQLVFDQEVGKKMLLCLSDTAALSRSKWLISRSVDLVMGNERAMQHSIPTSESPSPIALLAQLQPISGRVKVLDHLLFLRPSELLFFLHMLDLHTLSSVVSNDRGVAQAGGRLGDLLARLSQHSSPYKGSYMLNTLDKELVCVIDLNPPRGAELWGLEEAGDSGEGLLSSSLHEEHREAGASVLSSVLWLVNVARSSLLKVYQDPQLVNRGEGMVRDLTELKSSLLARSDLIKKSVRDWERLQQSKDWGEVVRSQLFLLSDTFKSRKKGETWRGQGGMVAEEGCKYPLLVNCVKELTLDEGGIGRGMGWGEQDEEKEGGLKKLLYHSFGLEEKMRGSHTLKGEVVSAASPHKGDSVAQGGLPSGAVSGGMNPLWVIMQNVFHNNSNSNNNGQNSPTRNNTGSLVHYK